METIKKFTENFQFKRLFSSLGMGIALGAIDLPAVISIAILIFSGDLAQYAGAGIGMILLGGMIVQLIIAFRSSMPGMMGGPQDSPAAIIAIMATVIIAQMSGAPVEAKFITVTVAIIFTSVLSGVFFLVIGRLKLGRFIRYVPYPVVGGFIAGTGLLLVQGGFDVMVGGAPTFSNFGFLFTESNMLRWVPSLILGIALVLGTRRSANMRTITILLIAAILIFYSIAFFNGKSLDELRTAGWLLGPFPSGSLWKPLDLSLLSQVNWSLIFNQWVNIAAIALISMVALLLNSSALELDARKDINVDRELVAAGLANIFGGLAGSSVGYQLLGFSAIPFRLNINSRWIAIIAASVTGFVLLFGASLLSMVPALLAGGILFFLGISFLVEWLYETWHKLPLVDYALIVLILGVVGVFGFLEGVGVGIAIAMALFVVNYSRIDIVKASLSGLSYRSTTDRPAEQRRLIQSRGGHIAILRLHGFVFFGTSHGLVERIQMRVADRHQGELRYLILDFKNVTAMDSSAVASFMRIEQLADADKFQLMLTEIHPEIEKQLKRAGFGAASQYVHFDVSLDHGMEWCEGKLLGMEGSSSTLGTGSIRVQLQSRLPSDRDVERFMRYLEKEEIEQSQILINEGGAPDSMYFLDSGELSAQLQVANGKSLRLRKQGAGTMVGEMSLFLKQARTATVVATESSELYRLSVDAYHKMMKDDPDLAFHLHEWIGHVLSTRLAENSQTLEVLMA
jgi:SulP family sulfate permease